MTTAIQFLRSSQESLRPNPTTLADGMPMINTSGAEPGLFFKTDNGGLTKIGPCVVGPDAPNINAQGFEGNSKGEMWLDTSGTSSPRLRVWMGETWTDGADVTISDNQTLTGQKTFTQAIVAQGGVIAEGQDLTAEGLSLSGVGYSTPTTSSMADTALTTKGYVDSKVNSVTLAGSLTAGEYLEGNLFDGSADTVWKVNASPRNEAETVVARDEDGNFSSNEITAVRFIGDGSLLTNLPGGGGGGGGGGNYLPLTGGNLSGDLVLSTDRIVLDATNGSGTFASGDITLNANGNITTVGQVSVGGSSASPNIRLEAGGNITAGGSITAAGGAIKLKPTESQWSSTYGETYVTGNLGGDDCAFGHFNNAADGWVYKVKDDGSINAAGEIKVEGTNTPAGLWSGISKYGSLLIGTSSEAVGDAKVSIDAGSGSITAAGAVVSKGVDAAVCFQAIQTNESQVRAEITASGSATFAGTITANGYSLSQLPQL